MRASLRSAFTLPLLLHAMPVIAQATTPPATATPAVLLSLGAGRFPRPRDPETGATSSHQILLGGALDVPLAPRLLLNASGAVGFLPVACAGGCAPGGTTLDLALLWHARSLEHQLGILIGPSIGRTTFDGIETSVGIHASAGVVRGIGPRITLRYVVFSGSGMRSGLTVLAAMRLGTRTP